MSTDAHMGDLVLPIFELPSSDLPDIHDGTLEDWEAVLIPSLDHRDFAARYDRGKDAGTRIDQDEIAFQLYLAWHDASQRIFIAVERFDAAYALRIPPEPQNTARGAKLEFPTFECCGVWDNLVVQIDGDHSGGQCVVGGFPSQAERVSVDNIECQSYEMVPEAEGTRRVRFRSYTSLWATEPPFMDGDGYRYGESPTVTGYELYITPWDELGDDVAHSRRTRLQRGAIVGLQVEIWDFDDTFNWLEDSSGAAPPFAIYSIGGFAGYADRFVDGLLIPCTGGDCSRGSPSAVSAVSWGRIKAAFAP